MKIRDEKSRADHVIGMLRREGNIREEKRRETRENRQEERRSERRECKSREEK